MLGSHHCCKCCLHHSNSCCLLAPTCELSCAESSSPQASGHASNIWMRRCKECQRATKQMSIRCLPPVLCLHVKRFEHGFKVRTLFRISDWCKTARLPS